MEDGADPGLEANHQRERRGEMSVLGSVTAFGFVGPIRFNTFQYYSPDSFRICVIVNPKPYSTY